MEANIIREKLRESKLYSEAGIKKIMQKTRTPSLKNVFILQRKHGVPSTVWENWIDEEKLAREK